MPGQSRTSSSGIDLGDAANSAGPYGNEAIHELIDVLRDEPVPSSNP